MSKPRSGMRGCALLLALAAVGSAPRAVRGEPPSEATRAGLARDVEALERLPGSPASPPAVADDAARSVVDRLNGAVRAAERDGGLYSLRGRAHLALARLAVEGGKPVRARASAALMDLGVALRLEGPRAETRRRMAAAHGLIALDALEGGADAGADFEQALADLDGARDLGGPEADLLEERAWLLFRRGEGGALIGMDPGDARRNALLALDEALAREPERHSARVLRARVRSRIALGNGSGDEVQREFDSAIADLAGVPPGSSCAGDARIATAELLRLRGEARELAGEDGRDDFRAAADAAAEAAKRTQGALDALRERGAALLRWAEAEADRGHGARERFSEAVATLRDALALRPQDPATRKWIVAARIGLGPDQAQAAVEDLVPILRSSPLAVDAVLLHVRARLLLAEAQRGPQAIPYRLYDEALSPVRALLERHPDCAEAHAWCGVVLRDRGPDLLDEALQHLNAAVAARPGSAFVRGERGRAHVRRAMRENASATERLGDLGHALEDLGWAVARRPDRADLRLLRARCILLRARSAGAISTTSDSAWPEALADLEVAVRDDPHPPGALTTRAAVRLEMARRESDAGRDGTALFRGAIEDASAALRLAPQDVEALQARGAARLRLAKGTGPASEERCDLLAGAAADLAAPLAEVTRDVRPRVLCADAWQGLAEARQALGRDPGAAYREAVGHLYRCRMGDPATSGPISLRIARLQMALGDWVESGGGAARPEFEAALNAAADAERDLPGARDAVEAHGDAWHRFAAAVAAEGYDPRRSLGEAIGCFARALALGPESASLRLRRGRCYRELGEHRGSPEFRAWCLARAMGDLDAAVALSPDDAEVHAERGLAALEGAGIESSLGRDASAAIERALADLDRALKLRPRFPLARKARGLALAAVARAALARGDDPGPAAAAAIAADGEALAEDPRPAAIRNNRGLVWALLARAAFASGRDPREPAGQARTDFDAALRLEPNTPLARHNRGFLALNASVWETRGGGDPQPTLEQAIADFTEVRASAPGLFPARMGLVLARQALAEAIAAAGGDAVAARTQGEAAAEETARTDPVSAALSFEDAARSLVEPLASAARAHAERIRTERAESFRPWLADYAFAESAILVGEYALAGARYRRVLAAADAEEAEATEESRATWQSDPARRELRSFVYYNLGCVEALAAAGRAGPHAPAITPAAADAARHRDEAFAALTRAVEFGFRDPDHIRKDRDLIPLREDPRFLELLFAAEKK